MASKQRRDRQREGEGGRKREKEGGREEERERKGESSWIFASRQPHSVTTGRTNIFSKSSHQGEQRSYTAYLVSLHSLHVVN